MTFLNSLAKGRKAELFVRDMFKQAGVSLQLNEDKRRSVLKKFDLFCNKSGISVECKHDLMSKKTGNVAIEAIQSKIKRTKRTLCDDVKTMGSYSL